MKLYVQCGCGCCDPLFADVEDHELFVNSVAVEARKWWEFDSLHLNLFF